jgi:hypothetical protein
VRGRLLIEAGQLADAAQRPCPLIEHFGADRRADPQRFSVSRGLVENVRLKSCRTRRKNIIKGTGK